MNPCYILTYSLTGECAVNINNVERIAPESQGEIPAGRCRLHFRDGSELLLDESCEIYREKAALCSPSRPKDIIIYG
ncbi:hypothetical protein [Chitinophaga agri]|uniref:Uncharacterized protein n=1 Tax=Chitinophaga agri TaxID=2703787 RepID=A0A6B9ZBF7_9BACT|nr:hypothetical protein [Chitinophaga agri]QHS59169.1 hypothetical protein GWR21_06075 [Chitinophaga agri]